MIIEPAGVPLAPDRELLKVAAGVELLGQARNRWVQSAPQSASDPDHLLSGLFKELSDQIVYLQRTEPAAGLEEHLQAAAEEWGPIAVTPPSGDLTKPPLAVFAGLEAAKAGMPFVVVLAFGLEEPAVVALLDRLEIPRSQYAVRVVEDLRAGMGQVLAEFPRYAAYLVDPSCPAWLADFLSWLRGQGVIPVGEFLPALRKTADYLSRFM